MGGYNSNLKIAGDFDFFLRCCLKKKINYHFYDKYTVQMALGGASSGLTNVIRSNLEVYKILSKNKIENKFFFIFFKLLSKILNLRLSFLYKKNIS